MKKQLGAARILENLKALKGYSTKRELADFFGVGPSAVTDWTNRKGDRIPEKKLAEIARKHGLRWDWLAHGEGDPYAETISVRNAEIELMPAEIEFINRIKSSSGFRKAVEHLALLPEEQLKLITLLAESLAEGVGEQAGNPKEKNQSTANHHKNEAKGGTNHQKDTPYLKWNHRYPLTTIK